jgi:hypothetical protein
MSGINLFDKYLINLLELLKGFPLAPLPPHPNITVGIKIGGRPGSISLF